MLEMDRTLVKELLGDKPVAYHPVLAKGLGSAEAAIFLSQLIYWDCGLRDERNGWFWKTGEEMEKETGLSRHEQDRARELLKTEKIISVQVKGLPRRTFYHINWDVIPSIVEKGVLKDKEREKKALERKQTQLTEERDGQTSLPYADKLDCHTPANKPDPCRQTISEITTETTTKITTERESAPAENPQPVKYLRPPAVEAFKEVRGYYPDKELWCVIDTDVGSDPDKLNFWKEVLTRWVGAGFKPRNVDGALDCFRRGELPSTKPKSNGHDAYAPEGIPRVSEMRREDFTDWQWARMSPENQANVLANEAR